MSDHPLIIRSSDLTVRVDRLGAELRSMRDGQGREVMTDADPRWWTGHAPLLFPFVGRSRGDAYRMNGRTYSMPQHGFARPFLKMDTQGHDLSVCEGAGDAIGRMLGVQTELGVRPIYEGGAGYRAMIDWLEARDFVPSAFFANNKGHFPLLVEMDGIFVNRTLVRD